MRIALLRLVKRSKRAVLLLSLFMILSGFTAPARAQLPSHVFQVGAWGDDASGGNMGVRSEIRTHVYNATPSDFDYFWVGDNLEGGGFIQFGFGYEPGYYCLQGEWLQGQLTCSGSFENIGPSDARWQWQYWPNASANDYFYGIGPTNSAGENGTWHMYSMTPDSENRWSFLLDGVTVAAVTSQWRVSRDPAYVIAEKVTDFNTPGSLGPVEFRNLSYLATDGWHSVDTLYVAKDCSTCERDIDNPYGVSLDGPNHIAAGSGLEDGEKGDFLWTSSYVTLTLSVPSNTRPVVTSIFGSQSIDPNSGIELPKDMQARVTLTDTRIPADGVWGLLGAVSVFQGWTGDVTSTNASFSILMAGDKRVQAVWATDYSIPILALLTALALTLVTARLVVGRRRPMPHSPFLCPTCMCPLYFVYRHQKWYCFNCKRYPWSNVNSYVEGP